MEYAEKMLDRYDHLCMKEQTSWLTSEESSELVELHVFKTMLDSMYQQVSILATAYRMQHPFMF